MMNIFMSDEKQNRIKTLYQDGLSAREIINELEMTVSSRTLQRWLKEWGIVRNAQDAFRLAVAQGKVTYHKNPNKLKRITLFHKIRLFILQRDGFKCVLCGNTAKDARLQVDHIDNNKNNNAITNLQTLCEPCNKGKYRLSLEKSD